jgi:selenocysteine-specific translation elongation factor
MKGGRAQRLGLRLNDVDQGQLRKGMLVEMEHTDDPSIAAEIALDHLTEHPFYYIALARMERMLKEK